MERGKATLLGASFLAVTGLLYLAAEDIATMGASPKSNSGQPPDRASAADFVATSSQQGAEEPWLVTSPCRPGYEVFSVGPGDTLFKACRARGFKENELAGCASRVLSPDNQPASPKLRIGETLCVPLSSPEPNLPSIPVETPSASILDIVATLSSDVETIQPSAIAPASTPEPTGTPLASQSENQATSPDGESPSDNREVKSQGGILDRLLEDKTVYYCSGASVLAIIGSFLALCAAGKRRELSLQERQELSKQEREVAATRRAVYDAFQDIYEDDALRGKYKNLGSKLKVDGRRFANEVKARTMAMATEIAERDGERVRFRDVSRIAARAAQFVAEEATGKQGRTSRGGGADYDESPLIISGGWRGRLGLGGTRIVRNNRGDYHQKTELPGKRGSVNFSGRS